MKLRYYVIAGVLVFLISLVLAAPVTLVMAKLMPNGLGPEAPQLAGLDGTLSDGHAASINMRGRPVFSNLHWHFRPVSLLLARAGFNVDATGSLTVDGKVARLLNGGIDLDDMRIAGPLKALGPLTGALAVAAFEGQFGLKLDSAKIRKGFPSSVEGTLDITGLKLAFGTQSPVLGDFVLRMTTDSGTITAKLESVSGPLDAGGEIMINPDHTYDVDLMVKAKPGADPIVQNQVRTLGQSDPAGFFHIKSRGNLENPG